MEPIEVAHRYFDAWNARDPEGVAACFAPGGTYTDPTTLSQRLVAATPIGADCIEATQQCIYQRRWAYHITLGEAF